MDTSSENDEHRRIMEGWLYLIRSNKFGFHYSRKRYYLLQNRHLKSFSSVSHSLHKDPVRSTVVNSCICVTDNGKKNIRGKVFFIFTLSGISSTGGCVKMNQNPEDTSDSARYEPQDSWLDNSGRVHDTNTVDDHLSLASITDPKNTDLSSYWTIFGCHNGLRLFKEARNQDDRKKRKNGHPAIAAMSVIDGSPEAIFQILMSFGSSRSEWDFCFQKGSVIESIDDHTDIVHKLFNDDWLPRGMKRRDLLLQRCWRRDDDGTYTIRYHSVLNKKCPPQKSYIRACLKSGGYVISPLDQHKQSIVRHMLDIDWKLWNSYLQKPSAQSLSVHMLGRLAALREFFKTNLANYLSELSSQEPKRKDLLLQSETSMRISAQRNENGESNEDVECASSKVSSNRLGLVDMDDDESDEYFDLPESFGDDQSESGYATTTKLDTCDDKACTPPSNILVKKLNDYTGKSTYHLHRNGCADLEEEMVWKNGVSSYNYKLTLPEDPTGNLPNSWTVPEPSLFQIRGATYFQDRKKIKAKRTLMQTVGVEWLRSDKREDDVAGRPGSIVQKFAADGRPEFFFIVNFQVPGSTTYNIASYYMTTTPIKDLPLLEKFIEGDDAFRNSRFKLLPHITKGPWILKQSARATLVGHMLKLNYIRGKNYIEIDIDVASSTLARGLASTALSCFSSLISETAFVLQANTPDELPEHLYGASRLNYLDVSKACWANP
ncbi:hypothetical protein OSB04_013634 [Centaurea solstitialis]|uniref:START domain-containing protein n=1 Tax=Centaurea solstitialis TaxID=347529 RepID=A0AA38TDM7_9ASTR|nr:hypothetical protein OSB04_013634 [Centaurea solstitialis]